MTSFGIVYWFQIIESSCLLKAMQPVKFAKIQSRVMLIWVSVVMSSVHFASDITSQDMLGMQTSGWHIIGKGNKRLIYARSGSWIFHIPSLWSVAHLPLTLMLWWGPCVFGSAIIPFDLRSLPTTDDYGVERRERVLVLCLSDLCQKG